MTGGKIGIEIDEAVWGALQGYTMPMESVYYLSCASDEGYAVPASYRSAPWRLLSDRALACGRRHGDVLYFSCETHDSMPVEYELCLWRTQRAWDPRMEAALEAQLESCRLYGMVDCPAYFGPYPAPQWTPQGGADRALSLENGIFWVEHGGQRYLAVCEPIYDAELSDAAKAEGRVVRDFIFFDPAACAIPLFESAWNHPGMAALIKSEDALLRALWKRFPGYLRARGAAPACAPAAPGPGEADFLREPVFPGP